jgi:hypothetical protein
VPKILMLGFLMELLSSCLFLSQLLWCLTMIFFCFFFNFYFIFKLWDSSFHLF